MWNRYSGVQNARHMYSGQILSLLTECDRNPSVADIRRKFVGIQFELCRTPFLEKFHQQNDLNRTFPLQLRGLFLAFRLH